MKNPTKEELKEIIRLHGLWLRCEAMGVRADLSGSNLSGSDLSGSDLRGSNLSGSDLSGSDLRGSNLRDSDLSGSDLRGSDLSGSDLRDSDLSGSNLRDSDLRDSDLRGSDLSGSDLRDSDLRGSDLSGSEGRGAKIKAAMGWTGLYRYWVFAAITETGIYIRMGCHWRTLEEWEKEFWNNNSEFPNDGSAKSNMRLAAFSFAKEWIKNNQ